MSGLIEKLHDNLQDNGKKMNQKVPKEIMSFKVPNYIKNNFVLKEVKCSTVAIALVFELCNTDTNLMACYDAKKLQEIINLIRDISFESDFMMPIIAAFPIPKGKEEMAKMLHCWQRDQEMHRGNFFIYPYVVDNDEIDKSVNNLLDPQKADLSEYSPDIYTFEDFRKNIEVNNEDTNQLDESLKSKILMGLQDRSPRSKLNSWKKFWKEKLLETGKAIPEQGAELESNSTDGQSYGPELSGDNTRNFDRVKSITIKNFKGLSNIHLNLDADIVLITGPNGHGKSSLVEALSLALNRFHPDMKDEDHDSKWPQGHFFHYGAPKFEITVKGLDIDDNEQFVKVTYPPDEKTASAFSGLNLQIGRSYLEGKASEYESANPKLMFRLSTFLPDHVKLLFDTEDKDGILISDLFEPLPVAIQGLYEALETILDDSSGDTQSLHDRTKSIINDNERFKSLKERLPENAKVLRDILSPLAQTVNLPESHLSTSVSSQNHESSKAEIEELSSFIKNTFFIDDEHWREKLKQLPGKVQNRLATKQGGNYLQLISRERKLEDRLNEIEMILSKEMDSSIPHRKELSYIFSFLGDNNRISSCIDQFKNYHSSVQLHDIADELKLIDVNRAQTYHKVLENLESEMTKQLLKEKESLVVDIQKAKKEISSSTTDFKKIITELEASIKSNTESLKEIDKFLTLEKSSHQRAAELEKLNNDIKQFTTLKEIIEKRQYRSDEDNKQPDVDYLKRDFEATFNRMTERFALGKGMEKMTIEKAYNKVNDKKNLLEITADETGIDASSNDQLKKRGKACFSLGQRSQIALAFLLTSRELIQNSKNTTFPHRVIILDDPSATFDMTNLLSQTILWRQLAYHPNPIKRYQLFIVSHHELFTDRLLDMLCPPGGKKCSMHLLRFSHWPHQGTNPTQSSIKTYKVDPAPSDMEKSLKAFEHGLKCQERFYE